MFSRRDFLAFSALALSSFCFAVSDQLPLPSALQQLERSNGGRLGVTVLKIGSSKPSGYRADERFPMCSTFKFLLAAAVLHRIDRRQENPDRLIAIPAKPLINNSPLTELHAGGTMTVTALLEAALTRSDNTAANLLLDTIGGPAGLTSFARSIGDKVTRLDRTEPSLNEAQPGDPRDTTSPSAMAEDLNRILLGNVLSPASRQRLITWMEGNRTGLDKLRAGVPAGWRVADKTGSNGRDTTNDIAVFWPPSGKPIIVAAYITQCPGPESKRAEMLKQIGELAAAR